MATQTSKTDKVLKLASKMGVLHPRDLDPYGIPELISAASVPPARSSESVGAVCPAWERRHRGQQW